MEQKKGNQISILAFGVSALIGATWGIYDSGALKRMAGHFEKEESLIDSVSQVVDEVRAEEAPVEEAPVEEAPDEDTYSDMGSTFDRTFDKVVSHRRLEYNDLVGLSSNELRILRNIPYAVAGRIFRDENLGAYFGQFDWYVPRSRNVSDYDLTDVDRQNVALIKSYE